MDGSLLSCTVVGYKWHCKIVNKMVMKEMYINFILIERKEYLERVDRTEN